jgi:hypothetical protein
MGAFLCLIRNSLEFSVLWYLTFNRNKGDNEEYMCVYKATNSIHILIKQVNKG